MQDYYKDEKNCYQDIFQARKAFGGNITKDAWDNMVKGLCLMFLYCPEGIQDLVQATIDEACQREPYLFFKSSDRS